MLAHIWYLTTLHCVRKCIGNTTLPLPLLLFCHYQSDYSGPETAVIYHLPHGMFSLFPPVILYKLQPLPVQEIILGIFTNIKTITCKMRDVQYNVLPDSYV